MSAEAQTRKKRGLFKRKGDDENLPSALVEQRMPLALEFTFSAAQSIVVTSAIVTAFISFLTGSDLWETTLRTGTAVIAIGTIVWLISFIVANTVTENYRAEQEEKARQEQENPHSTIEMKA